jgi:hypothetical protein
MNCGDGGSSTGMMTSEFNDGKVVESTKGILKKKLNT